MNQLEKAIVVGEKPQLLGVLTKQNKYETKSKSKVTLPTILLLNSGLLGHIGPFRLYVRMARKFADMGFSTCRFDLSGIGDSERHLDVRTREEQHMGDIKAVMNHLDKHENCNQYIVMGICTGADNAHKAMLKDKRVVGAVSIDGYAYKTPRYYFNLYAPKLISFNSWKTLSRQVFNKVKSKFEPKQDLIPQNIEYRWVEPSKEKTEQDYKVFIERNVNLLTVFTASWPYNYLEQHADSFKNVPFGENLQVAYLENAEHIFPLSEDRTQLMTEIVNWLVNRFLNSSSNG